MVPEGRKFLKPQVRNDTIKRTKFMYSKVLCEEAEQWEKMFIYCDENPNDIFRSSNMFNIKT